MFRRRKCCHRPRRCSGVGYFFIAIGTGFFLAYLIPRYFLITMLGLGLIGAGVCLIKN